jgi:hypothetical protein
MAVNPRETVTPQVAMTVRLAHVKSVAVTLLAQRPISGRLLLRHAVQRA